MQNQEKEKQTGHSRILKFRCWDKENKSMWYGGYVVFGMPLQTDITDLHQTKMGLYPRKDSVLMQYTGLKDTNGKEIFEGDIIKLVKTPTSSSPWDNMEKEVTFENGMFVIAGRTLYQSSTLYTHTFEVIGNIYQNPELIKK